MNVETQPPLVELFGAVLTCVAPNQQRRPSNPQKKLSELLGGTLEVLSKVSGDDESIVADRALLDLNQRLTKIGARGGASELSGRERFHLESFSPTYSVLSKRAESLCPDLEPLNRSVRSQLRRLEISVTPR